MIFSLVGVTAQQEHMLRTNPTSAGDMVMVAQGGGASRLQALLSKLSEEQRKEVRAKFEAMKASLQNQEGHEKITEARSRLSALGEAQPVLDLQKSWHILHYAFTGQADPDGSAGGALLAGDDVGEDMGYGPPRVLGPQGTKAFADFLARQTVESLQARLDHPAMKAADIYALPNAEQTRQEIAAYFPPLRDYVLAAAAKNNGLLLWLA
jgi:hypothetical protein